MSPWNWRIGSASIGPPAPSIVTASPAFDIAVELTDRQGLDRAARAFDRHRFARRQCFGDQDRRIGGAGRRLEAIGKTGDEAMARHRIEIARHAAFHGVGDHAQIVDAVGVVSVVVSEQHGIQRIGTHAQKLLAQIRRCIDQHTRNAARSAPLNQHRAAAATVLRVGRIALPPHGADARHAAGRPAAENGETVAHDATVPISCGRFALV